MSDKKKRDESYDPSQKIVPNALPHIHRSSSGKRYCDHCGQPMIENELTRPVETYKGSMSLPELRTRFNTAGNPELVSEYLVSKTRTITGGLSTNFTSQIARDQDIPIGQLPKGSTKAHINIRDFSAIISPAVLLDATAQMGCFFGYRDIMSGLHLIGAWSGMLANVGYANFYGTSLVIDVPFTDGAPPDFGAFYVEAVFVVLGGAGSFSVEMRSNISVLFEV